MLKTSAAVGAGAALGMTALPAGAEEGHSDLQSTNAAGLEPDAGNWRTWLLDSGDELQLGPPPGPVETRQEMDVLKELMTQRDAAALEQIHYWNAGAPGYRWNEMAMSLAIEKGLLVMEYRMLALLNVAIYDATVAAWHAKYAYNRRRPAGSRYGSYNPKLSTVIDTPASPSYPCEHAVAAGAAATVLGYIFPDEVALFAEKAEEAGRSRLLAGVSFPSDVEAGLALGRAVGELAVARGMADRSDQPWDGVIPEGPGLWYGEPAWPTMGSWATWVLEDGSQLRPPPPPAWDSPERAAELEEVRSYPRDAHLGTELNFWAENPAGRPVPDSGPFSSNQLVYYYAPVLSHLWITDLNLKLFEHRWDLNPPRAARAYALVSVAGYDATVANWEAKFHYWTARPNQFDPTITTILPTYPIPDYPSGHAATIGGTAEVLAYLFPESAHYFQSKADECAASRLWAGIHFRSASEAGVEQGRAVAREVIAVAQADGAS
jgi:membrane-associated phospholipid phosphatase